MARSTPELKKKPPSRRYLSELSLYFVRVWGRQQRPATRYTAIMHAINRTAVIVFVLGTLFFVIRRGFFG